MDEMFDLTNQTMQLKLFKVLKPIFCFEVGIQKKCNNTKVHIYRRLKLHQTQAILEHLNFKIFLEYAPKPSTQYSYTYNNAHAKLSTGFKFNPAGNTAYMRFLHTHYS